MLEDLEKLKALARSYAEDIRDDVGGTRLDRAPLLEHVDAALSSSRLVQIRGLPGSGKSALLKRMVQRAIETVQKAAKTGKIGDGKIFILPIEEAVRIRTEERGEKAV